MVSVPQKPVAVVCLPPAMFAQCFSAGDVQRLRNHVELVFPTVDSKDAPEEFWQAHADRANIAVTGWDAFPLTDQMIQAAPGLRCIAHAAGSVKPFVPPLAWQRDIVVFSANDVLAVGVAETTLGMIIAGCKGLFFSSALTAGGAWQEALFSSPLPCQRVRELFDLQIGLIGAGAIGRQLIRLLENFEVSIAVYDPFLSEEEAVRLGVRKMDLPTLMGSSDVVSLHAPAIPANEKMLGAAEFAAMKDGAIFINTARGMLVDESALVARLQGGTISAFIDVTSPEPPATDHPFRTLPNVVLTPHLAGAISNGCLRMGRRTVNQLIDFCEGKPSSGEVDPERLGVLA